MVGRRDDIRFLEEQYQAEGNSLLILYGRQGTGKTTLINEFVKNRNSLYYLAKECCEKEQQLLMKEELEISDNLLIDSGDYNSIFSAITDKADIQNRLVLVIDEVYNMVRQGNAFIDSLTDMLNKATGIMVVLISSSIQWVENYMVKDLGKASSKITGFRKLNSFGFLEIVNRFPDLDSKTCVYIYGILGGVPAYVDMWDQNKGVRDNVIDLFLKKNSLFFREPERFLKSELRELSFYNTILANLACGREKLNDLYVRTGFSRAKISVYIKNLIQLDIVEKVFSIEQGNYNNACKGLYRIKDPFMHFWYRFVFPNQGILASERVDYVYDKVIVPAFDEYMHKYFVLVCKEYLNLMNQYKKLPVNYELCESWYGKEKTIDIIARDKNSGAVLAGVCKWDDIPYDEDDFALMLQTMEYAGINGDYYHLFSKAGFTDSFRSKCEMISNVELTDLNEL